MDAVLKRHRRFSSVLAALAFYVFDEFPSQVDLTRAFALWTEFGNGFAGPYEKAPSGFAQSSMSAMAMLRQLTIVTISSLIGRLP
jgi:hypothetical protein